MLREVNFTWFEKARELVLGASVSPPVKEGQGYMAVTFEGPESGGTGCGSGGGLQGYPA